MKFLLILLLAVPSFAQVNATYDKFKDITVVSTDPVRFDRGGLRMAVKAIHKGQKSDDLQFYLVFRSSSQSWLFLRSRELIFLADGERIELGKGSHDGEVSRYSSGVTETMIYVVSRSDLEKMNKAVLLEMKLGFFEVQFKPGHRQGMKEMLSYAVR